MKVAVVVIGMMREFELAHRSWSFLDHDMFLTTWDKSEDDNPALGFVGAETITGPYPAFKEVNIHHHDGVEIPALWPNDNRLRPIWLMRQAIRHLRDYEHQTGQRYERVLLLRPDLFLDSDVDVAAPLRTNEVMALSGIMEFETSGLYVQDMMFLMHRQTFDAFEHLWDFVIDAFGPEWIHAYWVKFFRANGIAVRPCLRGHQIARRNSRDIAWTDRQSVFDEITRRSCDWMATKYGTLFDEAVVSMEPEPAPIIKEPSFVSKLKAATQAQKYK